MISEYELANIITGATRAEGGVARKSSATILGKAVEASENGMVRVVPEGDVFAPDGDNTIIIPTSPSVRAGDTVQIGLVGGVSKRPMVVAAGGEGDRQDSAIADAAHAAQVAWNYADSAHTAASIAQTAAQQAQADAATAKDAAEQAVEDAATAYTAAQNAQTSASDAATAAGQAQTSANAANTAAQQAQADATAANTAAQQAQADATDAKNAATQANTHANSALTQLSIIEDVAGTLDWISKHGTYTLTGDTTVQEGTVYFEKVGNDYIPIAEPTGNPHAQGWYTLDVTDSQSDYIMAHLAVTSAGLWVLPSGIGSASDEQHAAGYKTLLSSDGMTIYDDTGRAVATYGEGIVFDSNRELKIGNDNAYVEYYDSNGDEVADSLRISANSITLGGSDIADTYATKDEAATTGEGSGESVTVDSGAKLRSLEVEGKSVQDGTPTPSSPVPIQVVGGANYFKGFADATTPVSTTVGVSFTMDAGVLYATGTATGTGYAWQANTTGYNRAPKVLLPAGTYTVCETTGLFGVRMGRGPSNSYYDVAPKGGYRTITLAEDTELALVPQVISGTVYNNSVPVIMISSGSEAQPYVPYGSLGLKVKGKNLLRLQASDSYTLSYLGITWTVEGGILYANGTATGSSTAFNTERTANCFAAGTLAAGTYTAYTSCNVAYLRVGTGSNNTRLAQGSVGLPLTFTLSAATDVYIIPIVVNGNSANHEAVNVMLNSGSTSLPYTPYVDSLTPITLNGNVLASLPDGTKDVLTVDDSGHCVITKRVGNSAFDGSETWGKSNYVFHTTALQQLKSNGSTPNAYSSAFRAGYINSTSGTSYLGMFDMFSAANPYFRCSTDAYSDGASFKAWLSATPMQVVYELATPTTIDLGYITMPELADGCTVEVLASLTPTIQAGWYTENGAALADFATKSELQVTADGISSVVSTKVGSDEVISKINQSAETIQIEAERIEFDGTVVFNAIKSETDAAYDAKGAASTVQANLTAEESERKAIYGTCSTAAGTAAKAVTCANFQLFTGVRIAVKFLTASTVAAPTLNVNGTGAKAIWYNNAVASSGNPVLWGANATLNFVYDGTVWVLDEKAPNYTITCTTDAATRDKAASVAGALVVNGTTVGVSFSKANTYASDSVRFNFSSTGAATISVNRTGTSTTNTFLWPANVSFTFVRNGAWWYLSDNGQRKYITHINDNGVSIHAANNPTQNYLQLDASEIGFYESGSKVARFMAKEIDLGLAPTGPSSGNLATKIAMNGGMFSIESSLTEPATSGGTDYQNSLTVMRARSDLLDNWQMTIDDKAFLTMSEMNYGYQTTLRVDGKTQPLVAGVDATSSKTDNTGTLTLYGGRILEQTTTNRMGDPVSGYSITRVYTGQGFRVENTSVAVSNDVVTVPISFAADSSITWGDQVAASIDPSIAPPTQIRVFVYARNSWTGPLVPAWININNDGTIRINSDAAIVWFGHATYVRKPAGWTAS